MTDDAYPFELSRLGHCRDCRWWEGPYARNPERPSIDDWKEGRGHCQAIESAFAMPGVPVAPAVMDPDDSYCVPQVWTNPDFCCVQFQPIAKPAEPD